MVASTYDGSQNPADRGILGMFRGSKALTAVLFRSLRKDTANKVLTPTRRTLPRRRPRERVILVPTNAWHQVMVSIIFILFHNPLNDEQRSLYVFVRDG